MKVRSLYIAAFVLPFFFLPSIVLSQRNAIAGRQVKKLESSLRYWSSENDKLIASAAYFSSPQRTAQLAKTLFDMHHARPDEIEYIEAGPSPS